MFSYIVTSQKSTAVNHSVVCSFFSHEEKNLIIAKGNNLEIHTLKENTLIADLDISVYGKIISLDMYRPTSFSQDLLFVLTESKNYCVLAYDLIEKKIVTKFAGTVKERKGREICYGQTSFMDPDNRMIGMHLYEGQIKV